MQKAVIFILLVYLGAKAYCFDTELNVLSYTATIEPDIQNRYLKGSVLIRYQLPLNEDFLVLNSGNLQIDSIKGIHTGKFTKKGDKLTVDLNDRKELINDIIIYYHGYPTSGLFFDQANDQSYTIYSTNQWMVCNHKPGDKAKISLSILISKEQECIASGQLIRKEERDGKHLFQWNQNFDSPTYTYGFVIGNFQKFEYSDIKLSINSYAKSFSSYELERIFTETSAMISFFEEKSGIKYDQPSYSQILIGNHYQEMSGFSVLKENYGNMVLADSTETNLISHELAHQWWGNRITCKNWNHFWLNEAIATYMSAAYNEYRFGRKKYQSDIDAYFRVYEDIKNITYNEK